LVHTKIAEKVLPFSSGDVNIKSIFITFEEEKARNGDSMGRK
jgi:hypothetical protein